MQVERLKPWVIFSGALNEELLETSNNELHIYKDWGSLFIIAYLPPLVILKVFFTSRKMALVFF